MKNRSINQLEVSGEFIDLDGERYYAIRNMDKMPPFFMSVISDSDHWLFISSTGGLTAGRVSPETALFPYVTVDKIHDNAVHTGSKTIFRILRNRTCDEWEPFNEEHDGRYSIKRNLYKNIIGSKLCFEEINEDLQLSFRYTWETCETYGFVRRCEFINLGQKAVEVDMVDGLQNILPAGTPRALQLGSSNLIDAYKWTELDEASGLAMFTLYSGITDEPEPYESLKANTVVCLGLDEQRILISSEQLDQFRFGKVLKQETHKRGIRGAYLINSSLKLQPNATQQWQFVADIEQNQSQVVSLLHQLKDKQCFITSVRKSVTDGSDALARIMGSGDGFQATAEEEVMVHHYANVAFNILRGGVFDNQYQVSIPDIANSVKHFNINVAEKHQSFFAALPKSMNYMDFLNQVNALQDPQLERLCHEYLPITFGRRHGDPSRPWNQFTIKLKDEHGNRLLSYEGNWRDIFQNWEALCLSYPDFLESVISKFVNASTMSGYNPYRITKEGIDWEVEDPEDPWSSIGYWGDHQIIYLLKLLEHSNNFHPAKLGTLLHKPIFSYANVPYRIKSFEAMLLDAKDTVKYDIPLAQTIAKRVEAMGADGKLVLDTKGEVYQVNLLEKLLVPLLSKLSNLVIGGGIWLNTQRPEWNDANNALVGQGLSMVTLYYLRRYIKFLQDLLADTSDAVMLSNEVNTWLKDTTKALNYVRPMLIGQRIAPDERYKTLVMLGEAASKYRDTVCSQIGYSGSEFESMASILDLLDCSLVAVDHSIHMNLRDDKLYHTYNTMNLKKGSLSVDSLYPMLEGQVAILSSGAVSPQEAVGIVTSLFDSLMYRADQKSFMLYPDRKLPGFLQRNQVQASDVADIDLIQRMLTAGDHSLITRDENECYRFNADITNVGDLRNQLHKLRDIYGDAVEIAQDSLEAVYEKVFNHQAFTGRSGGMFGFEGLGCIYWHMVSKLLLAVQENFFAAKHQDADASIIQALGDLYYRVREGIGFNKTPKTYGAFPTDPYSHTPKHAGAQQPGMTGQVKEEVLSRFGELGICVHGGLLHFEPNLLRRCEFVSSPHNFCFLDVHGAWQTLALPPQSLAFTWCQVPIIYQLNNNIHQSLDIQWDDGKQTTLNQSSLPARESAELFQRSGSIRCITLTLHTDQLFTNV
ncbi:MAG: hypothetical protein R8M14_03700 [Ghiorsea sp.]